MMRGEEKRVQRRAVRNGPSPEATGQRLSAIFVLTTVDLTAAERGLGPVKVPNGALTYGNKLSGTVPNDVHGPQSFLEVHQVRQCLKRRNAGHG